MCMWDDLQMLKVGQMLDLMNHPVEDDLQVVKAGLINHLVDGGLQTKRDGQVVGLVDLADDGLDA